MVNRDTVSVQLSLLRLVSFRQILATYQFTRWEKIPYDATIFQRRFNADSPEGLADRRERDQILSSALQEIKLQWTLGRDTKVRSVIQYKYGFMVRGIHLSFVSIAYSIDVPAVTLKQIYFHGMTMRRVVNDPFLVSRSL